VLECSGLAAEKGLHAKNVTLDHDAAIVSRKNLYVDGGTVTGSLRTERTVRARNVAGTDALHAAITGGDVILCDVSVPFSATRADRKLRIVRSTADGIESGRRPILIESTCSKSERVGNDGTWGVCAED